MIGEIIKTINEYTEQKNTEIVSKKKKLWNFLELKMFFNHLKTFKN